MQFLSVGMVMRLAEHARDNATLLGHSQAFLDAPLLDHRTPPSGRPGTAGRDAGHICGSSALMSTDKPNRPRQDKRVHPPFALRIITFPDTDFHESRRFLERKTCNIIARNLEHPPGEAPSFGL